MKVNFILLILYVTYVTTVVKARSYSDVFPKNTIKYVITSKPYAQVRIHTPIPTLPPENPFLNYQPIYHDVSYNKRINQHPEESTVTKHPLLQLTVVPKEEPLIYKPANNVLYTNPLLEPKVLTTTVQNVKKEEELNIEEFSTDVPEFDEIEFQNNNDMFDGNDPNRITSDLDTLRITGGPVTNVKANMPSDASNEESDRNEFIFVKDLKRKYSSDLLYTNVLPVNPILENVEDSTVVTSGDDGKPRLKRNDNLIEEENVASTMAGVKYTGRTSPINVHLIFKNIHA